MKAFIKIFLIMTPVALMMFGFNNCARINVDGSSDSSSTTAPQSNISQNVAQDSGISGGPYALLSAEQTLSSMLKVTNLDTATNSILTEYNLRYGSLAAGSTLDLANSPLLLGSTSLAGEVCNTMIAKEAAMTATDRSFFSAVNFSTGPANISDAAFATSVRSMARSFWGRNEVSTELALFSSFKNDFIANLDANSNPGGATTGLLTGVCAAMLSSLDALSY